MTSYYLSASLLYSSFKLLFLIAFICTKAIWFFSASFFFSILVL